MITNKSLKCPRCGNEWLYKGSNEFVTSCSKCKTSVSFKKNMIQRGLPIAKSKGHVGSEISPLSSSFLLRGSITKT